VDLVRHQVGLRILAEKEERWGYAKLFAYFSQDLDFQLERMADEAKKRDGNGRRRRRGPPKKKEGAGGGDDSKKEGDKGERKPRERKPRIPVEHVPVPPSMIGKSCIGRINTLFFKGKVPYGWINVDGGNAEMPASETPRVYFSFKSFSDETYKPKRNLEVQFDIAEDEQKRPFAENVKLTANGQKQAAEGMAAHEARKAAAEAAAAEKSGQ